MSPAAWRRVPGSGQSLAPVPATQTYPAVDEEDRAEAFHGTLHASLSASFSSSYFGVFVIPRTRELSTLVCPGTCTALAACLLLAILAPAPASAQEVGVEGHDFGAPTPAPLGFAALTFERLRGPLAPEGRVYAGVGALIGILGAELERPRRETAFLERGPFEPATDLGGYFGAGETVAAATALLWVAGRVGDHERLAAASVDLASTFVATSAYTWALKSTVRKQRPSGGNFSFPSGHASVAFATATVLDRHFGRAVGYASLALATLTAGARMEDNRHYFSDVVCGAALGLAVAGAGLPGDLFHHMKVGRQGVAFEVAF